MPNINITVREKIAHTISDTCIVCGNSDYVAIFDFDAEWDAYATKTARFIWGGTFTDVPFTGNECPVPVIPDAVSVLVGVYAGDLHTTTAAAVGVRRSILGGSETEAEVSHEIKDAFGKMLAGKIDVPQKTTKECGESETITLADNAEYRLTNVTALTFAYPENDFECWIRLTIAESGDVAVVLPEGTKYIGSAPTFANDEMWELSIKDGVVIAQKVGDGT